MNLTRILRPYLLSCLALAAPLAAQDVVLDWNATALGAIRTAATNPPAASRILAILHGAMFDAVNGVRPRFDHYLVAPAAQRNASAEAAASTAAHDVLVAFYAAQSATFDALHQNVLSRIGNGAPKTRGIAWGAQVAAAILAARAGDGSANTAPFPGSNEPGKWRPTLSFGGIVRPALLPLWGRVQCFSLPAGNQLRPPAAPALPTLRYALEVLMVQHVGGQQSRIRTPDQTQSAQFWGYGPGTATPPGHWNQIAHVVAGNRRGSLLDHARLFALLNLALADAAIVSWDCKYEYNYWRPITAIQLADQDGNALTQPDTSWMPLLETPPFPEYTSGHSTFSGAAAAVLADFYGTDRVSFRVGSDDLPGVQRSFRGFADAAWESGMSRIYGGIHFMSANVHGIGTGYQTGRYVVEHELRPLRR